MRVVQWPKEHQICPVLVVYPNETERIKSVFEVRRFQESSEGGLSGASSIVLNNFDPANLNPLLVCPCWSSYRAYRAFICHLRLFPSSRVLYDQVPR
jgi:hypothetical protein